MNAVQKSELVPSTRFLLGAWIVLGIMMFILLGDRDVSRAQEARVLETARQMLDADWHGWLIPHLNGEPRLRKPPLCYWYTAVSYKLFGVNEIAGRLPTMLIGWLTVGVTFLLGRDIAGNLVPNARDLQRGFFSAAALASSFFFIRFTRSAETDPPTMLGTALALWAILRSLHGSKHWLHLAALGIAFSAMTKGPPAIYPLVFLITLCVAKRTVEPLKRFVTSGAIGTALVLSGAWWVYVLTNPAGAQVSQELKVIATGASHFGLFYEYVPVLLVALLPWTPFYLAGFLLGIFEWRKDETFRTIVYAIMCVFVPLAVTPQVQPHYLVPMLPCCATLVGWILVRTISAELDARWTKIMAWIFRGTLIACLVAGPLVLAVGYVIKKRIGLTDLLAMGTLSAASFLILSIFRRRRAELQIAAWASFMLIAMPIVAGWWAPTLRGYAARELAAKVSYLYRGRPMLTYGADSNIALSFNLRQTIPRTSDLDTVRKFVEANPDAVILIERDREAKVDPPLPYLLEEAMSDRNGNDVMEFYTRIGQPMTP
jgi:4-amino-4-deoxy-L-arabinose transferase-like glycosyltransferase